MNHRYKFFMILLIKFDVTKYKTTDKYLHSSCRYQFVCQLQLKKNN